MTEKKELCFKKNKPCRFPFKLNNSRIGPNLSWTKRDWSMRSLLKSTFLGARISTIVGYLEIIFLMDMLLSESSVQVWSHLDHFRGNGTSFWVLQFVWDLPYIRYLAPTKLPQGVEPTLKTLKTLKLVGVTLETLKILRIPLPFRHDPEFSLFWVQFQSFRNMECQNFLQP